MTNSTCITTDISKIQQQMMADYSIAMSWIGPIKLFF